MNIIQKIRLSRYLLPSTLSRMTSWVKLFMFVTSLVTIGAIVVDYGFVLDDRELGVVYRIYDVAWWIYLVVFTLRLIVQWRSISRKAIVMTAVTGIMLYLTALPRWFALPRDAAAWLAQLWGLLSHNYTLIALLTLFALLEVSRGVVSFLDKKTNPALLMAACFAIIILFGALLLLLPRSTLPHIRLPIADAIFVSTSAVCVTGLSTVDVAQTFTPEGQVIIALLIQIGGLGVMTITSFFAMSFMGGTGLYNQVALRDMVGSDTFSSLISTLLYILGFTFIIEAAGAVCIWASIHGTMGMTPHEELFFAVFHAVSAFCNAGFSTLTGNLGNAAILSGHNTFYLIITLLIVLGGIGFPILMNFKRVLAYYLALLWARIVRKHTGVPRYTHLTNINTKIVLRTTMLLVVTGTVLIAMLEWNGALAGMPVWDKMVHALFNSVSPRTAGFNSVDLTHFSVLTLILYCFLMWIGGASQSTAGGIKVNTFAVAFATLMAVVRGRDCVVLFNREISAESVRRALAVIVGSVITILAFFAMLVILEPEMSPRALLFETISAHGTVGSSLGITAQLGDDSKFVVSLLMFAGRVGLITLLMSIIPPSGRPKYRLPKDNVIIN